MKKSIVIAFGLCLIYTSMNGQDPAATEDWNSKPPKVESRRVGCPPSDAIILLGKASDLKTHWEGRSGPAQWKAFCHRITANRTGDIHTKESFGDCQLHVEFRTPRGEQDKSGQGKGNSGVYFQGLYEVQVLDSYENETYYNGQAGSIYKQSPPLVNSSRKPGVWQVYDIVFHAPRFKADGSLDQPATLTVFHNGVLIQDHFILNGASVFAGYPKYEAHGDAPLLLQDHGNPVQYRNIWIRRLSD